MSQSETVIEAGAESIVVMSENNGKKSVTKSRRPNGKTQYKFEAFAYDSLEFLGASVPHVMTVSDDELVTSAFDGETIDDQVDLYNNETIFHDIARDLALNRKVEFEGFGRAIAYNDANIFRGEYGSWSEYLNKTYDKLRNSILLTNIQKNVLSSYWNDNISKIKLDTALLVHGDFALSAVFVKGRKYEGIIDFGDAFIGDPLLDLAYFRFKEITKDYGRGIYNLLLNNYLEFSNLDRKYIEDAVKFYMIYWAVERVHVDNLDQSLINKFVEKTEILISELSEQLD